LDIARLVGHLHLLEAEIRRRRTKAHGPNRAALIRQDAARLIYARIVQRYGCAGCRWKHVVHGFLLRGELGGPDPVDSRSDFKRMFGYHRTGGLWVHKQRPLPPPSTRYGSVNTGGP
jgi:hypothetical protein